MDKSSILTFFTAMISVIALLISVFSFLHNKVVFLFTVVNQRADKVNNTWEEARKDKGMFPLRDSKYSDWSGIISEIIITKNIIERICGTGLEGYFSRKNDMYKVFWEQINTDLRQAIVKYEREDLLQKANDPTIPTFQQQMDGIAEIFNIRYKHVDREELVKELRKK